MVFLLMPMSLKKTYCFVHHVEMISGFLNKIFVLFKKNQTVFIFFFFFPLCVYHSAKFFSLKN